MIELAIKMPLVLRTLSVKFEHITLLLIKNYIHTVNAIQPAAIRTPLYQKLGLDSKEEQEMFDLYKSRYPLGRIGEVSDTSAAIAYLTSDSASFLTGVI